MHMWQKENRKYGFVHKGLVLIAALAGVVVLGGCGTIKADLTFHDDGTITSSTSFSVNDSVRNLYPQIMNELKKMEDEERANGNEIKKIHNGFSETAVHSDIQSLVDNGGEIYRDNGPGSVRYRKGVLYDMYSLHLGLQGKESSMPGMNDLYGMDALYGAMLQSTYESAKFDYRITLPQSADATNAKNVSADQRTYTWDLKPALFGQQDVKVNIDFRIYHKNVLYAFAGIGAILLICALVCFIYGIMNKTDAVRKKQLFIVAGVLLAIVLCGGGYIKYMLDNPPVLTAADNIIKTGTSTAVNTDTQAGTDKKDGTDQPAQTASKPAVPLSPAEKTLQAYYKNITQKNYRTAYDMMTPELQQQIGAYEDYAAGYKTTISSEVSNMKVISSSATSAKLEFTLTARDTDNGGVKVQYFAGQATLSNVNGVWKISDTSVSKTGEARE